MHFCCINTFFYSLILLTHHAIVFHCASGACAECIRWGELESQPNLCTYLWVGLLVACGFPWTHTSYFAGLSLRNRAGYLGDKIWFVPLPQRSSPPVYSPPLTPTYWHWHSLQEQLPRAPVSSCQRPRSLWQHLSFHATAKGLVQRDCEL